jgi:hypothetical protein
MKGNGCDERLTFKAGYPTVKRFLTVQPSQGRPQGVEGMGSGTRFFDTTHPLEGQRISRRAFTRLSEVSITLWGLLVASLSGLDNM